MAIRDSFLNYSVARNLPVGRVILRKKLRLILTRQGTLGNDSIVCDNIYIVMKSKTASKNGNRNGNRDYSHLPRAVDFKLPKIISPELKELMDATREAMEALQLEEDKYGKKPRF